MPSPKKNTAYTFDIALVSQASRPQFQSNPTIAAGDFKVSTDEGALNNLTNLPTVAPAASRIVKITLTAAEMNGDRVVVQAVDAAGAEWDEAIIYIDTTAVTVDDLVRSTTPANTLDVSATGEVGLDFNNVKVASAPTTLTNIRVPNVTLTDTVTTYTGNTVQTGDAFARLGAPTGASVSADVAVVQADTDNIQTRLPAALVAGRMAANAEVVGDKTGYALTTADKQDAADELLNRNLAGAGSGGARNIRNALRILRNKRGFAAGTLTVYQEDDTTSAWTATVTQTAGNPVTDIDPV